MIFTVEIKASKQLDHCEVELYLDREALDDLIHQLSFLRTQGDHAHFFTPSWGGMPLSDQKQRDENTLVHHLRIGLV